MSAFTPMTGSPHRPAASPTASERRFAPRAKVDRPVQVRLVDDARGTRIDARLADLSASGVGIRLARPIAPGKEFLMTLPDGGGIATPLRYRAARCRPLGNGEFHVGAAFVRSRA